MCLQIGDNVCPFLCGKWSQQERTITEIHVDPDSHQTLYHLNGNGDIYFTADLLKKISGNE